METTQRQLLENLLKRDTEEAIDYIDKASRYSFNVGSLMGMVSVLVGITSALLFTNVVTNKVEDRVANYATKKEGK